MKDEITREERIEDLLDRIDQWDKDDLIAHVKENYRHQLSIMDDEMLIQEWHDCYSRDAFPSGDLF